MKTRILTAAVLVPALLLLVLAAPKVASAIVLGFLMALAAYELLYRTELLMRPRLVIYAAVMAFAISLWSFYGSQKAYFLLMLLAYFILLFSEMMLDHVKVHLDMLGLCFLAGVIVPYMLSALIRILALNIGRYVVMIPFIAAFAADAGAYFIGTRFGRYKLTPVISPNKTIEGLLGGFACATVGMLLYGLILDLFLNCQVHYGLALLYGISGAAVGTVGDLCFSVIKRQAGIKDYGDMIPGHGGVLDRLDSMVLVAPLMEALILLCPLIVA